MIQTKNLTKTYGSFSVVNNINLNIPPGEIYGFLGPNGAGKTSTIMMLLGIVKPTSGEIYLFDEKYHAGRLDLRKAIGVVPEKHPVGMWKWMTAYEYLKFFGDFFDIHNLEYRIGYLLERVDLADCRNKKIASFSRGMLQKISIIRALLHDPDLLFLDEPISGLDPLGIKKVRDLIIAENREGRTIFVSSHLLSEMEKICHKVAIIFRGKLIAEDNMNSLLKKLTRHREIEVDLEEVTEKMIDAMKKLDFVLDIVKSGRNIIIKVPKDGDFRKQIAEFLIRWKQIPLGIKEKSISLEEAFTTITHENVKMLAGMGGE